MTFTHTDTSGDRLTVEPGTGDDGLPVVALINEQHREVACVHIPIDRIEELVAGLRDTARQAAGAAPDHRHAAALQHMGVAVEPRQL